MPRVYLPLLPLPALAVVVAVAACTRSPGEETTRVIPPPVPYAVAVAPPEAPRPAPPAATPPPGAKATVDAPSEDEVKEFERAVRK